MIIYRATNLLNGKSYIGQTIYDINFRKASHLSGMKYSNLPFHNALKKYGSENFNWTILEYCSTKEELNRMEAHYIKQYNTLISNGYNLTLGGEGAFGWKATEENKKTCQPPRKNGGMNHLLNIRKIMERE